MPKLIICADDYGISPGVGRAIRTLVARGRVSATGCMTTMPHWPAEAPMLADLRDRADVGLHLTLTDHRPLGAMPKLAPHGRLPPLGRLMALALARRLDADELTAEIERQLDAFERAMGVPPDFLDGHHHVHQLPSVREAIATVYDRRLRQHGTYVRYCDEPLSRLAGVGVAPVRAAVISTLGRGWSRLGQSRAIPGNCGFRGVRNFAEPTFAALFPRFLLGLNDGALLMCHPGIVDSELERVETVTRPREDEFRYLSSDACAAALAAAGVSVSRFFCP